MRLPIGRILGRLVRWLGPRVAEEIEKELRRGDSTPPAVSKTPGLEPPPDATKPTHLCSLEVLSGPMRGTVIDFYHGSPPRL